MVMVMMTTITQMEPRNFLPWILSALVHSVIIYGLYGVHGALDLDTPRGLLIIIEYKNSSHQSIYFG